MKKYSLLLSVLLFLVAGSCKKQPLKTYSAENSIYFAPAVYPMPYSSAPLVDSTAISFAFSDNTVQDSVIKIYVVVTGPPTTADRAYSLVVDKDSGTAKPGVHFVEPDPVQYIKAGYVRDTVDLKLMRTADMLDSNFVIVFRLKDNENFNTAMEFKMTSATRRLSFVKYSVHVNDVLRKPGRWLDTYLGTFSRKKLFLICELLNTTPEYLDVQAPVADIVFYGRFVQRYLRQMEADGKTIYEENGTTKMVMGPSVQ